MKMGGSWGRLFFCSHASLSMGSCKNLIMMTPLLRFTHFAGLGAGTRPAPTLVLMVACICGDDGRGQAIAPT